MGKKYLSLFIFTMLTLFGLAQRIYNVKNFGATGNGKTDDAVAIQKAIDACSKTGGKVLIPAPGIFMAGPFNLKSNIEF